MSADRVHTPEGSDAPARRWGIAWLALASALALHVVDEAANDFLSFYNPMVERLGLPFPTFSFDAWLAGLIVGIVLLLALSPFVFRGARQMAPLSYFLGVLMVVNGAAHIVLSVIERALVPGVLSSPVLMAAAVWLLVAVARRG